MTDKNKIEKFVFKQVNLVPFGSTSTYKMIAAKCGFISPRKVGKILGKNNHLISIPCHRIIYSSKKIGGYKLGTDFKKFILEWEKKIVS
ncbi:MAG: MGMT family protein [Candidatus Omnitrophica bacterium]|nr:MGMT family protein [Candidatus Omnitrophota bacterium]